MKTTLVIIFIIFAAAVLIYAASSGGASIDTADIDAACLADVKKSQEESQGLFCTQEIRLLSCPRNAAFSYEAPNGCEISFLSERGWK